MVPITIIGVPASIPMASSAKPFHDPDKLILDEPGVYRRLVGRLMYLTITRLNITFSMSKMCQFA